MAATLADLETLTGGRLGGDPSVVVGDVVHDSRRVTPGSLFCCVRGAHVDGHDHAGAAIDRGAVALLVDHPLDLRPSVPQLVVADTREAMGPLAARVHGDPSATVAVLGVTGTNGKTTTTMLAGHVLRHAGVPAAVLGTLSGTHTTPEAPELQRWLADRRDEGVEVVAIEVSSHALDQHRIDGTWVRVAAFTNLSQDHLDHHGSMDAYFEAKARLFTPRFTHVAVVNVDDPRGAVLADRAEADGLTVIPTSLALADDLRFGPSGSTFVWRGHEVALALGGSFNVANALVAAESLVALGIDPAAVAAGLTVPLVVPGRFELIDQGQPFTVVVDFAHTPDGLDNLLGAVARDRTDDDTDDTDGSEGGAVRVVFGCGGDRDRDKRPLMGAVAARRADHVVLTADNSRNESTAAILASIRAGFDAEPSPRATRIDEEPDRRAAIALALAAAGPGDVVVLAGKGHETTQTIGAEVTAFDDRAVARELLRREGWPA